MHWVWIFFFGSFVSLSDRPTDLAVGAHDVPLTRPLSAITSGAALYIDVTSMVPKDELTIGGVRQWVERSVQPGCLSATLYTDGEASVPLEFRGGFSFAPNSLHLILPGPDFTVPVRRSFEKLTLTNCVQLRQIRIYWSNHGK